jgi:hypothetical protein
MPEVKETSRATMEEKKVEAKPDKNQSTIRTKGRKAAEFKGYSIAIHRIKGIIVPPEEIEWMRRDKEGEVIRGMGWGFVGYDEWIIASSNEKKIGLWNLADKHVEELGKISIFPKTGEYGCGITLSNDIGMSLLDRITANGQLAEEINDKRNWGFNERLTITGLGNDIGDGIFIGEVNVKLDEMWETEEAGRGEQLKRCARIELGMYAMRMVANTNKGENVDIDFNEEDDDMWLRTKEDRAGGKEMSLIQMIALADKGHIVIGCRKNSAPKKLRIGTSGLLDLIRQIEVKCYEWGRNVYLWATEMDGGVDMDDQEEGLSKKLVDESFRATGALIFGFTKECISDLDSETLVDIVIEMAKGGIKGACFVKRDELMARVEAGEHRFTVTSMGMMNNKNERVGIYVEYTTHIMVGMVDGRGLKAYESRNYMKRAIENASPEIKIQLSRQFMSEKEMKMIKKGMDRRQDFMVVAARGLTRMNGIDDVIRRSFKAFLAMELRIQVYVWILSIRHNDEKGLPKDDSIMLGLISEGGGERLSARISIFDRDRRKGMMLIEGLDFQLFKDAGAIWNTSKPAMIGRAGTTIEVICPKETNMAEVLEIVHEAGVHRICIIAQTTRRPNNEEIWTVIPANGENVKEKVIKKGESRWSLNQFVRHTGTSKTEVGFISWANGAKRSLEENMEDMESSSVSSNSISTMTTVSNSGSNVNNVALVPIGGLMVGMEERQRQERDVMRKEILEATTENGAKLRDDMMGELKKNREEQRVEEGKRIMEKNVMDMKLQQIFDILQTMALNPKS